MCSTENDGRARTKFLRTEKKPRLWKMQHFIQRGRYMAYSTLKAASVKPDQKLKPYFIVWGLLMQCWTHQRCSENITVFFPTCTSSKKLNLILATPVKLLLNVEAITSFCFQKSLYVSGYRHRQNCVSFCACYCLYYTVSADITVPCSPFTHSCTLCLQH